MLAVLELEVNSAHTLPPIIQTNTILTTVLASFNQLGPNPPIQLCHFGRSLKKLHLGCNQLITVDELLPSLTKLVELTLEGNRLTSLPPGIGQLKRLKELWLHGNLLNTLPDELGKCASLTVLQCHHNRLSELPQAMASLSKLQGLYLQSNLLSNLHHLQQNILRHLPLQNLGLGNNKFDLSEAFDIDGARVGLGWNQGEAPRPSLQDQLSMWFASTDHHFDPACKGTRGQILLIAFAAQGPGMQQWLSPVAASRSSGLHALDALYVADPSNSYYLQDPNNKWEGVQYYEALVRSYASKYEHVLLIGSSMGASACLLHAHLGSRAIAFAPRIDLSASHGVYVPEATRKAGLKHTLDSLEKVKGIASVHCGRGNFVDKAQVEHVRGCKSVRVVEHPTFHHNVPAFLERAGVLVALIRRELLEILVGA